MINRKTRTVKTTTAYIVSFTCDCCQKVFTDEMDTQEFLHIDEHGGYNSAIGDQTHYECDICSACVKKLLGEYLRITGEQNG